ncbi:MAG: sigma 54-interacting transcriptional regulator [Myxococcota bacterium]|nr:sigma 54-interacting transcriptional regulator [Myxococcota bacterium]
MPATSPSTTSEKLAALFQRVHLERDFQAQASALIEHLSETIAAFGAKLGVIGVYLRDQAGYLAVHVSGERSDSTALRSASMWQWVEQHRQPVLLDLLLQILSSPSRLSDASPEITLLDAHEADSRQLELSGSLVRLLDGPNTHVMAVPLWGFGRTIKGMLTLELEAPLFTGAPEKLLAASAQIEVAAALIGPQLVLDREEAQTFGHLQDDWLPVVGQAMAAKLSVLERFATTDETLLLSGASGSGKSRIARWCHARSQRSAAPFETLNLLAVPADMQMAELFGWRKGAFTGAVKEVDGALERAKNGTLFIDEIDKLSMDAQAGLLQLLEEGSWRKLGESGRARDANVRFIVGTNQDLLEQVRMGTFRQDLYYRINVLPMHMPNLSERRDEIAAWARFMIERTARSEAASLDGAAIRALERQPWPGNLRQLDNVIRRAWIITSVRGESVISAEDIEAAMGMEHALDVAPAPSNTSAEEGALMTAFREAASAFVEVAISAEKQGVEVSLDLVDGLRGKVLEVARERFDGDLDKALALLGKGGTVENRNQHRILKRELKRLEQLEAFLDEIGEG